MRKPSKLLPQLVRKSLFPLSHFLFQKLHHYPDRVLWRIGPRSMTQSFSRWCGQANWIVPHIAMTSSSIRSNSSLSSASATIHAACTNASCLVMTCFGLAITMLPLLAATNWWFVTSRFVRRMLLLRQTPEFVPSKGSRMTDQLGWVVAQEQCSMPELRVPIKSSAA